MKKIASISVVALLLLVSCKKENQVEYEKLAKAEWLLGNWQHNSSDGLFSEKWNVKNDSTFLGNSSFVIEGKVVFSEEVNLVQRGKDLFYAVKITSEPSEPTEFKLTSSSENKLVFENPENDFPKKITYNRIHNDSIYAEISGGGNPQGFPMKREK
ncbi:MAG: DUF6265 family protein [Flavobacteriaceae bacterium]